LGEQRFALGPRPGVEALHEGAQSLLVAGLDSGGGHGQHEPLGEAITRRVTHVAHEAAFDMSEVLDQIVEIVALGVEQARLGEEGHERLRLDEDRGEILLFDDHFGRVQLEIDLVEVLTPPAGEMAVEEAALVVDRRLTDVGVDLDFLPSAPLGEMLL
jgi:hypothetical protein